MSVNAYVQDTNQAIVTSGDAVTLSSFRSADGLSDFASLPGPNTWSNKQVSLFGTLNTDMTLLPFDSNLQLNWNGNVVGTPLADGTHTLCVTVTDADSNTSQPVCGSFTIAPLPTSVAVTASPTSVNVTQTSAITAIVKDQNGNPVPNVALSFTPAGGTLNIPSGTSDAYGRVSATFTAGTSAGSGSVTACAGTVCGSANMTIVQPPPVGASISVIANPTTVSVGNPSAITVLAQDQNLNPMPGVSLGFTYVDGTVSPVFGVTDASGRLNATFTAGASAGAGSVTACAGASTCGSAGITVVASPPPGPVAVSLFTDAKLLKSGQTAAITATVSLNGSPAPNVTLDFSGMGGFPAPFSGVSDASGHVNLAFIPISDGVAIAKACAAGNSVGGVAVVPNSICGYQTISVDLTPPQVNLADGFGNPMYNGETINSSFVTVAANDPVVNGVASGIASVVLTGPSGGTQSFPNQTTAAATFSNLSPGAYTLQAFDAAGNLSPAFTFTYDPTTPTAGLKNPQDQNYPPQAGGASLRIPDTQGVVVTGQSLFGICKLELSGPLGGSASFPAANAAADQDVDYGPFSLPPGKYSAAATDCRGRASKPFLFEVYAVPFDMSVCLNGVCSTLGFPTDIPILDTDHMAVYVGIPNGVGGCSDRPGIDLEVGGTCSAGCAPGITCGQSSGNGPLLANANLPIGSTGGSLTNNTAPPPPGTPIGSLGAMVDFYHGDADTSYSGFARFSVGLPAATVLEPGQSMSLSVKIPDMGQRYHSQNPNGGLGVQAPIGGLQVPTVPASPAMQAAAANQGLRQSSPNLYALWASSAIVFTQPATLTFHYVPSTGTAAADAATLAVFEYDGTQWTTFGITHQNFAANADGSLTVTADILRTGPIGVFAVLPTPAGTSGIVWTGDADDNWNNAVNWFPVRVPASSDDAVIDQSAVVTIPAGSPAAAFRSLTLGDAAGSASPILKVSGTFSALGKLLINPNAALQQDTTRQLLIGPVTVMRGGKIFHTADSKSRTAAVSLSVAGDFDLQAGAAIAADGLGYAGGSAGSGPGGGGVGPSGNAGGGGGGHGGTGGTGSGTGSANNGGAANDSTTAPSDSGSGGGGSGGICDGGVCRPGGFGGAGGGAVVVAAAGGMTINGLISADGAGGGAPGGGGGAGGTIDLSADTLEGSGTLQANGGSGGTGGSFLGGGGAGGGGGGGRVSITVQSGDSSSFNVKALSGAGAQNGGAGVVSIKTPGGISYNLAIGDPAAPSQSGTPVPGAALSFSTVGLVNCIVSFDPNSTVNLAGLVVAGSVKLTANSLVFGQNTQLDVKSGGFLQLAANSVFGSNLIVENNAVFQQMGVRPLDFFSVDVRPGGLLTHGPNTNAKASVLNLNVAGDFNLQAGSTIAAGGLGYAGGSAGSGPGGGLVGRAGNVGGGGGGHGGTGGIGSGPGSVGGAANDSITAPSDLGSGGGGSGGICGDACGAGGPGGAGGGAVVIAAGGAMTINGLISVDGVGGATPGGGGGAGGTINLSARSLTGAGSLQASGGFGGTGGTFANGGGAGGGGGGGRVSITAQSGDSSSLNVRALSGAGGGSGALNGGAGVASINTSGGSGYNLSIGDLSVSAQSGTPIPGAALSFSSVSLINSILSFDPGSTVNLAGLTAAGSAALTSNNLIFSPNAELDVKGGGSLRINANSTSGADLVVESKAVFQQTNMLPLGFASINVQPGGLLTHGPNTNAKTSVLNLNAAGDFNLQAGSTIAADGLGYAGGSAGSGPGGGLVGRAGNVGGGGGGHGGGGGAGSGTGSINNGGASNDSTAAPSDLGSGGGGSGGSCGDACGAGGLGGAGGGAVVIAAGGAMTINGLISANGIGGGTPGGGGGAGGTINVSARSLSGAGIVQASGGSGGAGASVADGGGAGGGGGGGIIALRRCGNGAVAALAAGGNGINGAKNGGAGVVFISSAASCVAVPADMEPPRTSLAISPPNFGASPTFISSATPLALNAVDDLLTVGDGKGLGVAHTFLSIDSAPFAAVASSFTLVSEGTHTVSYYSVDVVGNTEQVHVATVAVDNTAPMTQLSASGPSFAAAFGLMVSSQAVLSLAAVDPLSHGPASGVKDTFIAVATSNFALYGGTFSLSGTDGIRTIQYYSRDNVLNVEVVKSTTVLLDDTPPVTTAHIGTPLFTATDGTNYVTPAAPITFTAVDPAPSAAASGVSRIEISIDGSAFAPYAGALNFAEGKHAVQYRAVDNVGNVEGTHTLALQSDNTPPITTLNPNSSFFLANGQTFASAGFNYAFSAQDPATNGVASGVASTQYRISVSTLFVTYGSTFSLAEGVQQINFQSQDNVGNLEVLRSTTIFVDATPPVTTLSLGRPQFAADGLVYVGTATQVVLISTDPASQGVASGVRSLYYSLDGAPAAAYGGPFMLSGADGLHAIADFGTDNVGNQETVHISTVALDATPPVTALVVVGGRQFLGPTASAFYASSDTRFGFSAIDPIVNSVASGLALTRWQDNGNAFQTFVSSFTLSEGSHALGYQSQDNVQNLEVLRSTAVLIDATPPVTTVSIGTPTFTATDGTIYVAPATPVAFSAADPNLPTGQMGSGLNRTEISVDGGPFATYPSTAAIFLPEGRHVIAYRSIDNVGNAEAAKTLALQSDAAPPMSSLVIGGAQVVVASSSGPVVLVSSRTPISISAVDPISNGTASGVRQTLYSVNGGGFTVLAATASFTLAPPDGPRTILFFSQDNVLNTEIPKSSAVILDATPPSVALLSPGSCDSGVCRVVKGRFPVLGTALDLHLALYALDSAPGQNAGSGFTLISSASFASAATTSTGSLVGISSGTLGVWNTKGLSGWQTLRLAAADLVQNVSTITINVFVGDPGELMILGNHEAFNMPQGVAVAPSSSAPNIYVADTNADRVAVFSATGTLSATFGRSHDKDRDEDDVGFSTVALRLDKPKGVAVDGAGNIYVADTNDDRVLKLSAAGQVLLALGRRERSRADDGRGVIRFKPGQGPGEFNKPSGVAVNGMGAIYVADTLNGRVQVFSASGTLTLAFALPPISTNKDRDEKNDDEFGPGNLGTPFGIAVDAMGDIYTADPKGHRVLEFDPTGRLMRTFLFSAFIGHLNADDHDSKRDRTHDKDDARFVQGRPEGVAVTPDGQCLLVSDRKLGSIFKFDGMGDRTLAFGQPGKLRDDQAPPAQIEFLKPVGLALDAGGNLYVADRNNERIEKFGLPTGQPALAIPPPAPADTLSARDVIDKDEGGQIVRDDGAAIQVPGGALANDLKITVSTALIVSAIDESNKQNAIQTKNLKTISAPVEYNPEGTTFAQPVAITLPYDPKLASLQGVSENDIKINYWNRDKAQWEAFDTVVDKDKHTVTAKTTHFSLYQVLSGTAAAAGASGAGPTADPSFGLRSIYVFPNPAVRGKKPTFHIAVGVADSVTIKIFDIAGRPAHQATLNSPPAVIDDGSGPQYAYEYVWDGHIPSGVYLYFVQADKSGYGSVRKSGKFAVVR